MGKTAVIIIHGVGEQRPMGTVSGFTRLFAGDYHRSKVDRNGTLFELRRLSTYANDPANLRELKVVADATRSVPGYPPDTVFYEFYWAYHYRDTKPGLVIRWILRALWKLITTGQLCRLGRGVLSVITACLATVAVFLCAVILVSLGVSHLIHPAQELWRGTLEIAIGICVPRFASAIQPIFIGWVGDAARYFGTSPDNPIERQQIRQAGIDLLKRLHSEAHADGGLVYDSIVLVGHSLGSVIAYDVIMTYWTEINRDIKIDPNTSVLTDVERLTASPPPSSATAWKVPGGTPAATEYQDAQHKLVTVLGEKVRAHWRVRDLVTLGSPLTYARFLLADNGRELLYRQTQRELPTCPPTKDKDPDENNRQSFVFAYRPITGTNCVVPDQTAPFLFTRWTNLYFPQDPIGGPLRPIFGWGIRDIEARLVACQKKRSKKRLVGSLTHWLVDHFLGGAHLRYWELIDDDPEQPTSQDCADELRKIIHGG